MLIEHLTETWKTTQLKKIHSGQWGCWTWSSRLSLVKTVASKCPLPPLYRESWASWCCLCSVGVREVCPSWMGFGSFYGRVRGGSGLVGVPQTSTTDHGPCLRFSSPPATCGHANVWTNTLRSSAEKVGKLWQANDCCSPQEMVGERHHGCGWRAKSRVQFVMNGVQSSGSQSYHLSVPVRGLGASKARKIAAATGGGPVEESGG